MPEMLPLSEATQKFVLHWGEMGARWGINRSVAQVHALLFMSERPLTRKTSPKRWGWHVPTSAPPCESCRRGSWCESRISPETGAITS